MKFLAMAEAEWRDMNVREQIAAIDPDGDQELFIRFHEWASPKVGPRAFMATAPYSF